MNSAPGDTADHDAEFVALLAGDRCCPLCGLALSADDLSLTRCAPDQVALRITCARCGGGSELTVSIDASLSAELTPGEAFYFSQLRPLEQRDLTRVRELLRRHTSDLIGLL
jgi:hypothetical protein